MTFTFGTVWEEQRSAPMLQDGEVPTFDLLATPTLNDLSFDALFSAGDAGAKAACGVRRMSDLGLSLEGLLTLQSDALGKPAGLPAMHSGGDDFAHAATTATTAAPTAAPVPTRAPRQQPHSPSPVLPEYTGPLPSSFHDLTEYQIATVSFKDFSKLMAKSKLNDRQVHEAKKLRRRVKNRESARLCSTRKRTNFVQTESNNQQLSYKVEELAAVNEGLLTQHMLLQERCIELQKNESQLTREKVYAESECARLRLLLQQATDAGLAPGAAPSRGLYANAA